MPEITHTPASSAPPVRDLELESLMVGPATRMILLEADDDGRVIYHFGKRRNHIIPLPRSFARARLLLVDASRFALLMEPVSKRLEAMHFPTGAAGRTILMGTSWGKWIDERGAMITAVSIPELILQWNLPLTLYEARQAVGFEFHVNTFNKELFIQNARSSFRPGPLRYGLELQYSYPLGGFRLARVKTEDEATHHVDCQMELVDFPLIPQEPKKPEPARPGAGNGTPPGRGGETTTSKTAAPKSAENSTAPPPHTRPAGPSTARPGPANPRTAPPRPPADEKESMARRTRLAMAAAAGKPSPPPRAEAKPEAPPAQEARPLPRTELLSVNDMLTVIATERDSERRWKMIEANLLLGRPERTYPLIARYPELIGDQSANWPPARLKVVFGNQPGAVLIGVMINWTVNQVLALSEANNDPAKILEWLREREIDRLLHLNLANEIVSVEAARRALKVDRFADEAMIKKTWRTLLGFMNADHGRSEERAIHRKKDEIAKYLQIARNILLQHR